MQPLPLMLAFGAWVATAFSFATEHGISILCGLAALVASIYAIRVARATLTLRKLQIEETERHLRTRPDPDDDLPYE